jgi:hypothetical protein
MEKTSKSKAGMNNGTRQCPPTTYKYKSIEGFADSSSDQTNVSSDNYLSAVHFNNISLKSGNSDTNILQEYKTIKTRASKKNTAEENELKKMQQKYNILINELISIQSSIKKHTTNMLDRISPSNPYLNKIIQFNNGSYCYVTNRGVAKRIKTQELYKSLSANTPTRS